MRGLIASVALLALAGCIAPEQVSQQAKQPPAPVVARPPAHPAAVDLVLVDKSDRMLTVYAGPRIVARFGGLQFGAAPLGHKRFQGDERTPEGRYTIDYRNPQSAYRLSLHISYPNEVDRAYARARGRLPGGDIFIHGQPNGLAAGRVPGDWTDGCIALANGEIEQIWRIVPDGTPIEIRP